MLTTIPYTLADVIAAASYAAEIEVSMIDSVQLSESSRQRESPHLRVPAGHASQQMVPLPSKPSGQSS